MLVSMHIPSSSHFILQPAPSMLTWFCFMPHPPSPHVKLRICNWGISGGASRVVPARLSLLNPFPRKVFNFLRIFPKLSPLYPYVHPNSPTKDQKCVTFPLRNKQQVNHFLLFLFLSQAHTDCPPTTYHLGKIGILSRKKDLLGKSVTQGSPAFHNFFLYSDICTLRQWCVVALLGYSEVNVLRTLSAVAHLDPEILDDLHLTIRFTVWCIKDGKVETITAPAHTNQHQCNFSTSVRELCS